MFYDGRYRHQCVRVCVRTYACIIRRWQPKQMMTWRRRRRRRNVCELKTLKCEDQHKHLYVVSETSMSILRLTSTDKRRIITAFKPLFFHPSLSFPSYLSSNDIPSFHHDLIFITPLLVGFCSSCFFCCGHVSFLKKRGAHKKSTL